MTKIKINISEESKWIIVFLCSITMISFALISNITIEELDLINSENPMSLFYISAGLAFIATFVFIAVTNRLNRWYKGE